jgi:hypothetical protein
MSKANQEESNPTLDVVLNRAMLDHLKTIHTMIPGVIDSFDSSTQRAKVALSTAMEMDDGTILEHPPLINVPVQFYRWGGFVLTMPVKKGDECAVVFSERSMDRFLKFGEVGKVPTERRFFDLSDGFAVPGLSSDSNAIPSLSTDSMELRHLDGDIVIKLKDDGVSITNSQGELVDLISQLLQQLSVETVIIPSGSSAGTYNLTGAALYTNLKTLVDSFKL